MDLKYVFKYVWEYIRLSHFILILLMVLGGVFEGIAYLTLIPILEELTGSKGDNTSGIIEYIYKIYSVMQINSIIGMLSFTISLILGRAVYLYLLARFELHIISSFQTALRVKLIDSAASLPLDSIQNVSINNISNLMTEQITKITLGLFQFNQAIIQFLSFILFTLFSLFIDIKVGLILFAFCGSLAIIFFKINKLLSRSSINLASESLALSNSTNEWIENFEYLKIVSEVNKYANIIKKSIRKLSYLLVKQNMYAALPNVFREPIVITTCLLVIYLFIESFDKSFSAIAIMLAMFYKGAGYASSYFISVAKAKENFGALIVLVNQIKLFKKNFIQDPSTTKIITSSKNNLIILKNVSFCYNSDQGKSFLLDKINLNIPKNQISAIVGPSGSGKSTLIRLIMGAYQKYNGHIQITEPLKIGYVGQKPVIFDGSLYENIVGIKTQKDLTRKPTKNERNKIMKLLDSLGLKQMILSLPNGLETEIGNHGIQLSGGQSQRLAIGRELFRSPNLLVLDEATSALDTISDSIIQSLLSKLKSKLTIVIVAHKKSNMKTADNIIFMMRGKVIEKGNTEILNKNGLSRLSKWMSQADNV